MGGAFLVWEVPVPDWKTLVERRPAVAPEFCWVVLITTVLLRPPVLL